jgi:hypothetical protein
MWHGMLFSRSSRSVLTVSVYGAKELLIFSDLVAVQATLFELIDTQLRHTMFNINLKRHEAHSGYFTADAQ